MCKRNILLAFLIVLLFSTAAVGVISGYVFYSMSVQLEVKEPVEILSYPTALSLFPGETEEFHVEMQNSASVNYSITLNFYLNDTEYQLENVFFSREIYTVPPGEQTLTAWLKVSAGAPSGKFMLNINFTRLSDHEITPSPPPTTLNTSLPPSLLLLGSGAKWAAGNGSSALFISWKENWAAHHLTDGADWGPWPTESLMDNQSKAVLQALEHNGFTVESAGDIPDKLSGYDLVVIQAYWAIEPKHDAQIREYVSSGGNVVIISGVPCYFSVYSKDWWPGNTQTPDWLGGGYYVNAGGVATVSLNHPFGSSLTLGDTLRDVSYCTAAAIRSPGNNSQVIAKWDSGSIFAFTNAYGQGRVYYQADIEV